MPTTKRLIILANSRREGGYCVAGIETTRSGRYSWIRPIGSRTGEALLARERSYDDGQTIALLDVAEVPLIEPRPTPVQSENWALDTTRPWRRVGTVAARTLDQFLQSSGPLWVNGSSSASGFNNRVAESAAVSGNSLALIEVPGLEIEPFTHPVTSRKKVRTRFTWAGTEYVLDLTDPMLEAKYVGRSERRYDFPAAFLTVSLGSAYHGYCYKLAAAVIPKENPS